MAITKREKLTDVTELYPRKFGKTIGVQTFRHPITQEPYEYVTFLATPWCSVVFPLTAEHEVIALRQYRHAVDEIIYEFPGGNPHKDGNETPYEVGSRELAEETGFVSDNFTELCPEPCWFDPASFPGKYYSFIATECRKEKEVEHDPVEQIEVVFIPIHEWIRMLFRGELRDAKTREITFSALYALGLIPFHDK